MTRKQLMKPLIRCIQLYPVYDEDEEKDEHLEYIYQKAIEGLTKLKSNYDKNLSTVCHSLDFYITIINSHLDGENIRVASYEDSKQISNLTLSTNTQINIENIFKGIWEKDDIELMDIDLGPDRVCLLRKMTACYFLLVICSLLFLDNSLLCQKIVNYLSK